MSRDLIEHPERKTLIYQGDYLQYNLDQVRLPDGRMANREYIHHPGAVAAVPLLDDGTVILVRQFRYAIGATLLEIPAGKLETGEKPEVCIQRELAEEIGHQARHLTPLGSVWSTPGFTDELLHLYLATGLTACKALPDRDEFLEVVRFSKEALWQALNSAAVVDAKTLLVFNILEARCMW